LTQVNEAISAPATAIEPTVGFTCNFMCASYPPVQRLAIARMLPTPPPI
jgi:hypothetical protein